jgi:hypothetical protein
MFGMPPEGVTTMNRVGSFEKQILPRGRCDLGSSKAVLPETFHSPRAGATNAWSMKRGSASGW